MFTSRLWPRRFAAVLCVAVASLAAALPAAGDPRPALGQPWDPGLLPAVLTTIHPDGRGLPNGSGNARQGGALYGDHCASCHGKTGVEGPAARLVGADGWVGWSDPLRPVRIQSHPILLNGIGGMWPEAASLFAYIRRAMPQHAPKSLADDEVYALTAWILWRNGLTGIDDALTAETLPAITMPGRSRIEMAWPEASAAPAAR
jgi:cytochrome c